MRTISGWRTLVVCLGATGTLLACGACGGTDAGRESAPTDSATTSANPGVDAGAWTPPPSGPPSSSTSPIDASAPETSGPDVSAVYVGPDGSDTGTGSSTSPLKTIKAGLELASKTGKPLNLCAASYAESIVVQAGIQIDGGYDCAHGWVPTSDYATLRPASGVPITIQGASAPVSLAHLAAKAPDAFDASASSIALVAISAAAVTLDHVELEGGNGGDGTTPAPGVAVVDPAMNGADGESLASFGCALSDTSGSCGRIALAGMRGGVAGQGHGGFGGGGGNTNIGAQAFPGLAGDPSGYGGQGGPATHTVPGPGIGRPGIDGAIGAQGTPAIAGFGQLTLTGYAATNKGGDGQPGGIGGGGGGGAGGYSGRDGEFCQTNYLGGGGGQGGYGGAGGVGGSGATAGGASIALLSLGSHITLHNSILGTASGGRGGDSSVGTIGQPGGVGGKGGQGSHALGATACSNTATDGNADDGGPGGRGGKGGSGGPGGGGPSIALLAKGVAPTSDLVTFNVGAGGKGGKAIVGGDGADGISEHLYLVDVIDAGSP